MRIFASAIVNWGHLAKVTGASLAIGVGVTVVVALAVRAALIAGEKRKAGKSEASVLGLQVLTGLGVLIVLGAVGAGIAVIAGAFSGTGN